jgi:hypothetical protein
MSISILFIGVPSKAREALARRVHSLLTERDYQVEALSNSYLEVHGVKGDQFSLFDYKTKED